MLLTQLNRQTYLKCLIFCFTLGFGIPVNAGYHFSDTPVNKENIQLSKQNTRKHPGHFKKVRKDKFKFKKGERKDDIFGKTALFCIALAVTCFFLTFAAYPFFVLALIAFFASVILSIIGLKKDKNPRKARAILFVYIVGLVILLGFLFIGLIA